MSKSMGKLIGRCKDKDIYVSTHSAGEAGQCMQITQGSINYLEVIEIDKCQVIEMVEKMQAWLNDSN